MRYSSTSNGRSNNPASVNAYVVRTGNPGEREHHTNPRATNPSSRSVSTFALSTGNPARSSENDRGPCIRSRSTNVAHRPEIAARATSTGQSGDGCDVRPETDGTSSSSQVTVW